MRERFLNRSESDLRTRRG